MNSREEEEGLLMAKLDVVKDIRSKTIKLEKLKAKIMQQLQSFKVEDEHLRDYKAEIEHLRREKMMHVESLRLIERNLAVMEKTVLQANQERGRLQERTYLLFEEYNPLKNDIDAHRMQIGLTKLKDIPEKDLIQADSSCKSNFCQPSQSVGEASSHEGYSSDICSYYHPNLPPTFIPPNQLTKLHITRAPRRQQRPPMKSCTSCQELIHRNAPVCPMCKAKSKSRNPKNQKRKLDE
ncbi:zinc finger C4H2 domain-containing protein-like [Rhopilema esculentum]|uniref:zinc finger C4H2 domain-containing protein-like n=1 Tax=Rhopilema esculentum TaxID=499914 RepID=UPI0031DD14BC|eukprot:gene17319-8897_t